MRDAKSNKMSIYIRSFIFWIFMTCMTVIWAIPILASVVLPLHLRFRVMKVWPLSIIWALRVICGITYKVEGRENLPNMPAIVFSKHQSAWETIILQLLVPQAVYVAKKELLWIPFFGWAMSVLQFITIDRSKGRRAIVHMIAQAKDRLSRGIWIIVFPEGTRKAVGAEPDYKVGAAVMAAKSDALIVPVALNSGVLWPRDSFLKWPGEITIAFLPVIDASSLSAEQVRTAVKESIETKMLELIPANK